MVAAQQRPLDFMDVQYMKSGGAWTPSPDGSWMLYTVTTPDWQEDERQSDIHVVSMAEGVSSSRQLTYTEDKDESQPQWGPDGRFFVFASNRDSDNSDNQLYMMRHDGGEAQKVTDTEHGISGHSFSPDGTWLVYRSGDEARQQLYRLPANDLTGAEAVQITAAAAGVQNWE
jgi:Tol biopolymer transport system component